METKNIKTENLPFEQFKLLGLEKKDVLSLPESTLNALTSGKRTSLLQFKDIKLNELSEPTTLNAKLSIAISEDGKPYLKMHPVNVEPKNDLGLTNAEISYLKKEPLNLLPKMVLDKKGNLIDSFVSLDKTTNEYIAIKRESINAPDKINDIQLTDKQKTDFKNGKPIQLGKQNFQLDVNSDSSVSEQNLKSVKFKSGKYSTDNALMDIALIATGAGALVLLEHVAKMLLRNRDVADHLLAHGTKSVNNQANALLKVLTKNQEPINKIINDAIQEVKTNPNMRPTKANETLLKNLSEQLKSQNLNEVLSDQKIITTENANTPTIVQQTDFTKSESFNEQGERISAPTAPAHDISMKELTPADELDIKTQAQTALAQGKNFAVIDTSFNRSNNPSERIKYFSNEQQARETALLKGNNLVDTKSLTLSGNNNTIRLSPGEAYDISNQATSYSEDGFKYAVVNTSKLTNETGPNRIQYFSSLIQAAKATTGKDAFLTTMDDLNRSLINNQILGQNLPANNIQETQRQKETTKTATELNQKEDLKLELNKLRNSYESKGYFTDQEAAKNAVLTEQFNDIGKENKIAADDQTIPKIGQTENENKEEQHETTKLSIENNKDTNTQEITSETEKVTHSFLKR